MGFSQKKSIWLLPLLCIGLSVSFSACAAVPDATLARCREGVAATLARPVGHDVLEMSVAQEGEDAQDVTSFTDIWFINDDAGVRWAVLSHLEDLPVQTEVAQGEICYVKPNDGAWQLSPETRHVGTYNGLSDDFFSAKNFSTAQESGDTLTLTYSKAYLQTLMDDALAQLDDGMARIKEKLPQEDPAANEQIRRTQEFFIKNSPYLSGSFALHFDAEGRIVETVQIITQDVAQTAYVGEKEIVAGTQTVTTQTITRYEIPALSEAEAVIGPLWQEASSS